MTSDAQDSHRKHRGASSVDEEAVEKSSKRHKHRHHRHHRHRHGSKKREEETKAVVDDVEAPPPPPVELYDSGVNGSMPVEDVEEGEILDEEGVGGRDDGVSSAESGEIEAPGVGDHSNKRNLVCSDFPLFSSDFSLIVVPLVAVRFFFFLKNWIISLLLDCFHEICN